MRSHDHRRWASRVLARAVAGTLVAGLAGAQPAPSLRLPDGGTVEVLGLRRWTIPMLQDSLAKYAPGDSLQSHACAATLRYTLGFADAAATQIVLHAGDPTHVVVAVREPQDSARVRYRPMPLDTLHARAAWRAVTDVMARDATARGRPRKRRRTLACLGREPVTVDSSAPAT